jgi:hypothetical protein
VIGCFEELGQHLALPRGCLDDLRALLAELDVAIDLNHQRVEGEPIVHGKPLVEQWVERLSEFLGVPSKPIGRIGGGR